MVEKAKKKSKAKENFDLILRPHHVQGYANHESQLHLYDLPDDEYIILFRKDKGDFHSDGLILHWRNILKKLHDNLNLKFKYGITSDSICEKCDKKEGCHDKKHWQYGVVQKADKEAMDLLPELKLGKVYDGHYLKNLFVKKGWLK